MAKVTNFIPEPTPDYDPQNQQQLLQSLETMKNQLNSSFQEDLKQTNNHSSHETLKGILKKYFYLKKIKVDMSIIDKCNDYNLADQLTMICPLTSEEKQMLLETHSLTKRNQLLLSIIEISNRELDTSDVIKH